tara:strand:- start:327 stop:563 length:237 start_codon:yes stop_codon:yes gene_type:complete
MYAIKCTPSKYKPNDWYLLRDLNDYVTHVWTRESEVKKLLAKLNNDTLEITQDIPRTALERALKKKQIDSKSNDEQVS